ncbi:MAG: hypothetical protein HY934_02970 [Candidatus Firestonebacteria bacterium]|nr:hypothetical protein [Candidatus Firestonebacteria bacterium]
MKIDTRLIKSKILSPGKKAQKTAKWARIMTKWLITYSHNKGAKWQLIEFGGPTGSESAGIIDILAIRKNHTMNNKIFKRGDLFEIVLIQTKGGNALKPTDLDKKRLNQVGKYYHAQHIILAEWVKGNKLNIYKLSKNNWIHVHPHEIF